MKKYHPYIYRSETLLIHSYLLLDRIECDEKSDSVFDLTLNPSVVDAVERDEAPDCPIIDYTDFSGFSQLKGLSDAANQKVYLLAKVFAEKDEIVLINAFFSNIRAKLWVNHTCVTIHNGSAQYYVSVQLKQGINSFIWECLSPTGSEIFSLQLLNYAKETGDEALALFKVPTISFDAPIFISSTSCFAFDTPKFEFMYLLGPNSPYQKRFTVKVEIFTGEYEIGHTFLLEAETGKKLTLDLDKFRSLPRVSYRPFNLVCTFQRHDGSSFTTIPIIFPDDFSDHVHQVCDDMQKEAQDLDEEFRTRVSYLSNQCHEDLASGNLWSPFVYTNEFEYTLNCLKEKKALPDNRCTSGQYTLYIRSELDDSLIRVGYKIPEGYDPSRQYPAFLAITDGSFCDIFPDSLLTEKCLCFDVTSRGSTGGSYVGEASILSIYRWIIKNFSIDPNRTYILGGSHAGYATWSVAQNYPDIPAAIFPHISTFSTEKIHNITNTPIFYLYSDRDYVNTAERNASRYFKPYRNYKQYRVDGMLHSQLVPYLSHPFILNQMLTCKRNPYPDKIIFSTRDNRHLRSFWIELHGVQKHKKIARITASIEDPGLLVIRAVNIVGFTVHIPHQINRKNFTICINQKQFAFEDYTDSQIHFTKKAGWVQGRSGPIDYRKGIGLLDVYMNSLRLVCAADRPAFRKAAEVLARPNTNGGNHIINVDYPIYDEDDIPDGILSHNLILLGLSDSNRLMKKTAHHMPVICDSTGYRYCGEAFEGDYVALQIFGNPYYPQKSVLTVSTNQDALLNRVLFLRKLFIPYNFNGVHPFLNNQILVFRDGKYYAAYEIGEPLREIQNS